MLLMANTSSQSVHLANAAEALKIIALQQILMHFKSWNVDSDVVEIWNKCSTGVLPEQLDRI
jgi:hypothetical protein